MKFSCEACNAKYQISDDKVGPAGVKVRCKKCGHVTLVRKGEAEAPAPRVTAPGVEWWVAIDEQPVGPVGLEVVQHHWDQGEIGPESLIWYSGLAEWTPIGSVPELHGQLTGGHPPSPDLVAPPPAPASPAPAAPAPEEEWRPGAASALASLEEPGPGEDARASTPEPAAPGDAAPPPAETPPGGTDPTGVRPLPMAGLERTGEKRLSATPGPRGPGARPQAHAPAGQGRTLPVVLLVALAVVAIAAVGLWWLTK
jgi:predicted Zn finger-like uncharacterized protein